MLQPTVQLRSGGYLVINQAEALVAIDVNSGRSTRERNVEETALRTNLEAADEVARQLRLRDLAGLIVIDFIDMEFEAPQRDGRAPDQGGAEERPGAHPGRPYQPFWSAGNEPAAAAPVAGGDQLHSPARIAAAPATSAAPRTPRIHVLRGIEDEGSKRRAAEIVVHVATSIALYLLNHKRERLQEIEQRYIMRVVIAADDTQIAPQFRIDRVRVRSPEDFPVAVTPDRPVMAPPPDLEPDVEEDDVVSVEDDEDDGEEEVRADADAPAGETAEEAERRRRRRRRRRRGGRREESTDREAGPSTAPATEPEENATEPAEIEAVDGASQFVPVEAAAGGEARGRDAQARDSQAGEPQGAEPQAGEPQAGEPQAGEAQAGEPQGEDDPRNRRRGRRGGRRRRREGDGDISPFALPGADQPELPPVYAGPTPADPFGGGAFDIFDVMEQVERQAEAGSAARPDPLAEIMNAAGPEPDPTAQEVEPQEVTEAPVAAVLEPAGASAGPPAIAEIYNVTAPEPSPERLTMSEASAAPTPANDVEPSVEQPPAAPAILPILVGAGDEPPAEKKRGWWRR